MSIDFSAIPTNTIVWIVIVIIAVIVAFVVIRFFWRHVLKYLLQGNRCEAKFIFGPCYGLFRRNTGLYIEGTMRI